MKKKLYKKITQKTITIISLLIITINFVLPTKSQADVGGVLATPITTFALMLLDTIEGGLQYFFLGGPISTATVTFDADEYLKIAKQFKLSENKSNKKVQDIVDDYQSWHSFNFKGTDEAGWDYVVTKFSPAEIFSNQIPMFSINFINPPKAGSGQKTIASELQDSIASWYKALRMLALVGMLSMLVYVGIRIMLSSTASDKAKYKNMIMDWLIAICLLFFLHYIMEFTIVLTDSVTSMISSVGGDFEVELKKEKSDGTLKDAKTDLGKEPYVTNLMGLCRMRAQNKNLAPKLIYIIIYGMLVGYTVMFTFAYLKRVLMMAFLTVISPVVVLTYPIDKISDGNAQGFNMWLKEYVFNALIQPIHLILYTVLVESAINLATDNPIYTIAAMMFILPAEKIMRKFFNFQKAQAGTMTGVEGFAGGLIANKLIGGVAGKFINNGRKSGEKSGNEREGSNTKLRMQDKPNLGEAFVPEGSKPNNVRSIDGNTVNSNQRNTGNVQVGTNNNKEMLDKEKQNDLKNKNMIDSPDTVAENRAGLQDKVDYYNGQLVGAGNEKNDNVTPQDPELITANEAKDLINGPNSNTIDTNNINTNLNDAQEKRKRAIKGVKSVVKNNYKGALRKVAKATVGGGLALTAGSIALAKGDLSKAASVAGIGYGAGSGFVSAVPNIGKSIARKASTIGSNIKNQYREGAYGVLEAQKMREEEQMKKQKEAFMTNNDNEEKYKEMAYKLGTKDYKKVMENAYELKTYGIKDENIQKTLEVAYGKKGENGGVGLNKAAAVALQTQRYGKDVLLDEKKSQVLEKKFAKEIMTKGNGKLTEDQAKQRAKDVMGLYSKFT